MYKAQALGKPSLLTRIYLDRNFKAASKNINIYNSFAIA